MWVNVEENFFYNIEGYDEIKVTHGEDNLYVITATDYIDKRTIVLGYAATVQELAKKLQKLCRQLHISP